MIRRVFIFALILYFVSYVAYALSASEEISVKSSVDKNKLSQDQPITFRIEIKGNLKQAPEIRLPDLKNNFEIISSGQSQSISISGKEKNQAAIFEYILLPKNAGRLAIGEVELKYLGKSYKTAPVEIEVSPSKKEAAPKVTPQPDNEPSEEEPATII